MKTDREARVRTIALKTDRAWTLLRELDGELQRYLSEHPYGVECARDPETRRPTYRVTRCHEVPMAISLLAGEVAHAARSGLDHLAWQLVLANGKRPTDNTGFPIVERAGHSYKSRRGSACAGMRAATVAAIDALAPWKGGHPLLWPLHELDVTDKHRLLLAVGSASTGVNIASTLRRSFERMDRELGVASDVPSVEVPPFILTGKDVKFPLEPGEILFVDMPDEECLPDLIFHFDVVLHEPDVLPPQSVVPALGQFIDAVEAIVESLKTHL